MVRRGSRDHVAIVAFLHADPRDAVATHPMGHCPPDYVIGEVVSPGWCGSLLGSFID